MAVTEYFAGEPGVAYYAKPAPINAASWTAGVIAAVESGSTGVFTLSGLTAGTTYFVYERLGATPASGDDVELVIRGALSGIQAKTQLIGTGSAVAAAPVSGTGTITSIILGDDYLAENDRAFEWLIDPVAGFDIATCTCWFGGAANSSANAWRVQGSITEEDDKWKLSFDLPKTATESLDRGPYEWSVSVHDAEGTEVTRVRNKDGHKVALVTKYT